MLHHHPTRLTYRAIDDVYYSKMLTRRYNSSLALAHDEHASNGGYRCLSFDNGLAGVLHVATPTHPSSPGVRGEDDFPLIAALMEVLLGPPTAELPTAELSAVEVEETIGEGASAGVMGLDLPGVVAQSRNDCALGGRLQGILLDDDSPYVRYFRDLGLERVCDADWVRFEPAAVCGAPSITGFGRSRESPVPLSALAVHP